MGVTPELELDLPEDWFVLDPDPADRTAALARDVHTWAGADPERRAHRDDLAAILAGFGEEADDQGALFAAVYWEPGEYGPTAANLMVLSGSRSFPGDAAAEVAAVADTLAKPEPGDHAPRQVTTVRLPIGPAARLRLLASAPADQREESIVLDATQLWVPLPHQPPMVVISGSTPCLDAGDDIADIVDAIGTSLRFTE